MNKPIQHIMKPRHQELLTKLTSQADENIEKFLEEHKEIGKEAQIALRKELQPPVNRLLQNLARYRSYDPKKIITSQDSIYQQLHKLLSKTEEHTSTIFFEDHSVKDIVKNRQAIYGENNMLSDPHAISYELSTHHAFVSGKVESCIQTIQKGLHNRSIDENTYQTLQKITDNENTDIIDSLYRYFVNDATRWLSTEDLTLADIIDIIQEDQDDTIE